MEIEFGWGQKGWICPKCGRVYSPSIAECWVCNASTSSPPTTNEEVGKYGLNSPHSFTCGVVTELTIKDFLKEQNNGKTQDRPRGYFGRK